MDGNWIRTGWSLGWNWLAPSHTHGGCHSPRPKWMDDPVPIFANWIIFLRNWIDDPVPGRLSSMRFVVRFHFETDPAELDPRARAGSSAKGKHTGNHIPGRSTLAPKTIHPAPVRTGSTIHRPSTFRPLSIHLLSTYYLPLAIHFPSTCPSTSHPPANPPTFECHHQSGL